MNNRKIIKEKHELYIINQFIDYLQAQYSIAYQIFTRPDPPDAILNFKNKFLWLEIADIYRNDDEAKEDYSHAASGEEEYRHRNKIIYQFDDQIVSRLFDVLMKKISKESYKQVTEKYGRGILILNEQDTLFNDSTLQQILDLMKGIKIDLDIPSEFFKEVYLSFPGNDKLNFIKLLDL